MNPLIEFRTAILLSLIGLVFACLGILQTVHAVSPAPDGGYPHGNTAEGADALFSLNTGPFFNPPIAEWNTAIGFQALYHDISGTGSTAVGSKALFSNTGGFNTAVGRNSLAHNTFALENTAIGYEALFGNTGGPFNTAIGSQALFSNNIGSGNVADGAYALYRNTSGPSNTAVGFQALVNSTGGNNIALGNRAGAFLIFGNNNIYIGNEGNYVDTGTIAIGRRVGQTRTFIQGIRGATTGNANAIPVIVDLNGQLGTTASSERFKTEIKPMDKTSEAILVLKPVTFHYKSDGTRTPQFGLIAEEVAEVSPDLVVGDEKGDIYTVRYDAVNAMLLNEFLKEHRKVQEQEATITQLRKDFRATVEELTARLKEQGAKIEKVSAQLEASRSSPRVIVSNQ